MNDRLKFRAWYKPTKQLFEVWCFTPEYVYDCDEVNGLGFIPTNPAKLEDCVLEQCTGLKDKNGRLMFEGDLVKCKLSRNPGVIKWDQEMGAFRLLIPPKPLFNSSLGDVVEFDFKVVGNIHENPELPEEK